MSESGEAGLEAEYFRAVDLKGDLAFTQVDKDINFDWKRKGPANMTNDNFSIHWSGKIKSAESGSHILFMDLNDGGKLQIDGEIIMDKWKAVVATKVYFQAGVPRDIKVMLNDKSDDAKAILQQIKPSQIPEELR